MSCECALPMVRSADLRPLVRATARVAGRRSRLRIRVLIMAAACLHKTDAAELYPPTWPMGEEPPSWWYPHGPPSLPVKHKLSKREHKYVQYLYM